MISYLGSLVQFSPAAGRAGRCRQKSLCVGSSRHVLAKQPAVLGASPRARRAFSLRGPSARAGRFSGSLQTGTGACLPGGRGAASLGLSFPLAPPPASYLQRGWGGSSLEFLSPFVLQTAGGVFRLVNFSLALPQFKKISL